MAEGDSWFARGSELLAPLTQAGGGQSDAASAGGWELSEAQLKSLINRLGTLSDKIEDAMLGARPMIDIKPPGNDPHSERVAQVMNESGAAYMDSLKNQWQAVDGMRRAMQKTLDSYRGVEQDNTDVTHTVSHGLEGGI
ncbi:MAG: hypothetical protein ACRDQ5_10735 [Sciscionella sp.]